MSGWAQATPGVLFSCWMFVCWRVSCQKSALHWRGLQRFFRVLSEQREGAERQRTTLLERRADRGSDSTFQMADIARRILVKGSTSPPVCETHWACFLVLSLSSCLFYPPPSTPSCLFPDIPNRNQSFPLTGEPFVLSSLSFLFFKIFILKQFSHCQAYLLPPFLSPVPTLFSFVTLPLLFFLTPSLSAKHCFHMVMIIANFLIFALVE